MHSMQPCSNFFVRGNAIIPKALQRQQAIRAAAASRVVERTAGEWTKLASATALVEELRGAKFGRAGEPPAGLVFNAGPIPTEFPKPDVQPFPGEEPSIPGAPEVAPRSPPDTSPGVPPEVPPLVSPPQPDTTEVPEIPVGPEVPSTPGPEILPDPGRGKL